MIRWVLTFGFLVALGLLASPAGSAGEPAGAVKAAGIVKASRPAGAKEVSIVLTTADGKAYNILPDEKGMSLAQVMANVGERTEIVGVPVPEKGEGWLRVIGFTEQRFTAAHELWRHMRCNACVVKPATENAALPKDLKGATPVVGRPYDYKRRFTAWTRDDKFLWVAADNELLQFDLAGMKLVKSYGKAEGLPDALIYQLVRDEWRLWVAYRGGISLFQVDRDGHASLTQLAKDGSYVRMAHASGRGTLFLSDEESSLHGQGQAGKGGWTSFPSIPTAGRIAKAVDNGIWSPHWDRRTGHFITKPVVLVEKIYAGSYGDIYELADGKWSKLAENAYQQDAAGGKLYFITSKGLNEHDPQAGKTETLEPPEAVRGRYAKLVLTDSAAWVVAEPLAGAGDAPPTGGGLARFDLAARKWDAWPKIGEHDAAQVATLSVAADGAVWAVTMVGKYSSKSAHPGMTTTTRQSFEATDFALHRFDPKAAKWESQPLKLAGLESRLICGQDGCSGGDEIVPGYVEQLSVGEKRVFALTRLVPRKYFGGFWPCVEQIASRADAGGAWTAKFEHKPEDLWLQGEQPLVLNISNGELTRIGSSLKDQLWEAIGHDLVLGMFFKDGKHWVVTEGCVAAFDEAAGAWKRLVEPEYRWYWRATAALEDGKFLYVGSDRGLVARLDTETGRFEPMVALKDRTIVQIEKNPEVGILVGGKPGPLGVLPVMPAARPWQEFDADAVRFDGKAWSEVKAQVRGPGPTVGGWFFHQVENRGMWDKTQGNFLWTKPAEGPPKPTWYVKETFFPLPLCGSPDSGRVWLSTYTGILRLDLPKPDATTKP
ncbi:MAG TPA: hypothetical protein PK280_00025 [Planctomycetota bacterium]|nr:hypothetical protein [Planctomycetota bacterium]